MTEKEEIVRKGYNKIAKKYQADRHVFHDTKELEELTNLLPSNAKVLDVGCGAGVPFVKFLVESGFDVTGIDFSESMLKLAGRNVPEAKFIKQDMTRLGFQHNSFDGVTASYSIIHVPREKHSSLFQSFHRILKSNGMMLISIGPDEWEGTDEYYGAEMFWSHYNSDKSSQIIENAGFQIVWGRFVETGGERHYWILARNKK